MTAPDHSTDGITPVYPSGVDPEHTIADLGEQATIELIRAGCDSQVNGDDAAVLEPPNSFSRIVVTTDTLVEDRHFSHRFSRPAQVGARAVVQNVADIEAMGATPQALLLALSLPKTTTARFIAEFVAGVKKMLDFYAMELVGGDITLADKITIGVTATGTLSGPVAATTLDRARPHQHVLASGVIGYSAAGFALLEHFGSVEAVPAELHPLVEAHLAPQPAPGRGLVARATGALSMTDNSDGLAKDLSAIARASHVTIDLHSLALPTSDPLLVKAGELLGHDPLDWILRGGEDHTLLAVSPQPITVGFDVIGRTQPWRGYPVSLDGEEITDLGGWESVTS